MVANAFRLAILLLTIVGCVGCDQVTKGVVRAQLEPGKTISLFYDVVRLQHVENSGVFLSMGESLPTTVRAILFKFGGTVMVAAVLVWAVRSRRMTRLQTVGAALVCSGGLGNLLDRFSQHGEVTDFLNVGFGSLRTGIFNVADFALLLGVGIVVFGGSGARTRVSRAMR
jgi:signal peptidase II